MATTQYIGARYVPVFADPAEWDNTRTYEPLTIVMHNGSSYTSAQYVPKGIDIADESFWKLTGNYNAQVEQYRKEVATYDGRITANAKSISDETSRAKTAEAANTKLVNDETSRAKTAEAANTKLVNDETSRAKEQEAAIRTTPNIEKDIIVVFGDSWTATTQGNWAGPAAVFKNATCLKGYTFKHYGESGAGFVNKSQYTGITFVDEINQFIADTSVDKSRVRRALLIGGCNDIYHDKDLTEIQTAVGTFFSKLDALGISCKWFPNVSAPGCIYNHYKATGMFITHLETLGFAFPYLFNCIGGSFADSRHLTSAGATQLGTLLAENFFTNYMPPVIPRFVSYLGFISFDDVLGSPRLTSETYDDKRLVLTVYYDSEKTDPIIGKLTGSPFALPSSDSPEYTASHSEAIPALHGEAMVFYRDNTSDFSMCYNTKDGNLTLTKTPSKDVKSIRLSFDGIDSVASLF